MRWVNSCKQIGQVAMQAATGTALIRLQAVCPPAQLTWQVAECRPLPSRLTGSSVAAQRQICGQLRHQQQSRSRCSLR